MLKVENLDVFYGDAQALDSVSLEIGEGEIVAIVGANGAGKTSLIRTIAGMLRPARGRIVYRGADIAGWPSYKVCDLGIGQVAEGRQVFPEACRLRKISPWAPCCRARAASATPISTASIGLFPVLAERRAQAAGTLSGGEQQMLAIGRCLMGAPDLVMFDEPSLGLAPTIVQSVLATRARLEPRGADLCAGRAERRGLAQAREPGLRLGKRPHHAHRLGRGIARRRPRAAGVSRAFDYFSGGPMVTLSLPTPSTSHSILSPATVAATPDGVPVMMMSPATSSTISDRLEMISGTFQIS